MSKDKKDGLNTTSDDIFNSIGEDDESTEKTKDLSGQKSKDENDFNNDSGAELGHFWDLCID